jgi:hypothetical protein
MTGQQGLLGGALNGLGTGLGGAGAAGAAGAAAAARGGMVKRKKFANGTPDAPVTQDDTSATIPPLIAAPQAAAQPAAQPGPTSSFGSFLKAFNQPKNQNNNSNGYTGGPMQVGSQALNNGMSTLISGIANQFQDKPQTASADQVPMQSAQNPAPAPVNVGADIDPSQWANGGMTGKDRDFRSGGKVNANSPKEKAVKKGNSYANDSIPAVLSEGEVVLPRSITMSKDPVNDAAKFVAQVLAKRKTKGKKQ